MKRPTAAKAFADSAANPKLRTMVGAYVSNARCGPLLQSVIRKCVHTRQFENCIPLV